jgi:hypothetical protein
MVAHYHALEELAVVPEGVRDRSSSSPRPGSRRLLGPLVIGGLDRNFHHDLLLDARHDISSCGTGPGRQASPA